MRPFLLAVSIFLADQLTKRFFFVEKFFGPEWLSPIFRLTQHRNVGVGFDLPLPQWIILFVSAAVLLWLCRVWMKSGKKMRLSLALLIAAALGNFSDRLLFGFVRDWMLFFNRSVLNVADFAIFFGALWTLILLRKQRSEQNTS